MLQNKIQFQHGMSLSEFIECYGTQALCETALEHARWPDGFVCPECGERAHSRFLADGRQYWQCSRCRTQSTVCSGTLFHASKLPLTKWFQAIYPGHAEQEQPLCPVTQAPSRRRLCHRLAGQAQAA